MFEPTDIEFNISKDVKITQNYSLEELTFLYIS